MLIAPLLVIVASLTSPVKQCDKTLQCKDIVLLLTGLIGEASDTQVGLMPISLFKKNKNIVRATGATTKYYKIVDISTFTPSTGYFAATLTGDNSAEIQGVYTITRHHNPTKGIIIARLTNPNNASICKFYKDASGCIYISVYAYSIISLDYIAKQASAPDLTLEESSVELSTLTEITVQ